MRCSVLVGSYAELLHTRVSSLSFFKTNIRIFRAFYYFCFLLGMVQHADAKSWLGTSDKNITLLQLKKEWESLYLWYLHNRAQRKISITRAVNLIILAISCVLTRIKNWWHVRCLHFMSKLLIYKQLRLSYSKLSVLIFATFQFFMF